MNKDIALEGATKQALMNYIYAEVRDVCQKKGWRVQVRRKWSAREKPVSSSPVDDYEWKLIPGQDLLPENEAAIPAPSNEFDEGTYFVLGLEASTGKFVLQHDTFHCGEMGVHWFTRTYTEIDLWEAAMHHSLLKSTPGGTGPTPDVRPGWTNSIPPSGMLGRFLQDLTGRFRPNDFCIT
jgi:hypothetical protein